MTSRVLFRGVQRVACPVASGVVSRLLMALLEVEPRTRPALGHQPVLQAPLDHPHIHRVGDDEPRDHPEGHDAPEQELGRHHRPHVTAHHQEAHDWRHACHHRVHADEFGEKGLADILKVAPAHHLLHEERLEDEETEGKSRRVLDHEVHAHGKAERGRDRRGQNDAGGVPRHAVNGAADTLLPQSGREPLVCPGPGLFVGEHVEEESERAHVERDEDEAPLHDRGLGVVAKLVPGHIRRGHGGEQEPGDQEVIDGLDDHGHALPDRSLSSFPRAFRSDCAGRWEPRS